MSRTILLVEDTPNDIELALLALKRCGVDNDLAVARDGDAALDYLLCRGPHAGRPPEPPGLVLLDLKLPGRDGVSVLRTIRTTPALAHVPVVVLTGSPLEADRERALELGIERYVVKPMDLQRFIGVMCELVGRFRRH